MNLYKHITANNLELTPYQFKSELVMQAYLVENVNVLTLDEKNFVEPEIIGTEIPLKNSRDDSDGRLDMLAAYSGEYSAILELKKHEINLKTLKQVEGYLTAKEDLQKRYFAESNDPGHKWVGILVGTSICPKLIDYISKHEDSDNPIAAITLNRFRGPRDEIYVLSDSYLSNAYRSKDFSGFRFRGNTYNKGRLVNAVLKYYVEKEHSKISFSDLSNVFKKEIQGSHGCFTNFETAVEIFEKTGHKRYYVNDLDAIHLSDAKIATCNQWSQKNIKPFIECCENLGFSIEVV